MVAEFPVQVHRFEQRADILVYHNSEPFILCECKEPKVEINQVVLDQAMRYAQQLKTPFIYLTNGLQHVFMSINFDQQKVEIINHLPSYSSSAAAR